MHNSKGEVVGYEAGIPVPEMVFVAKKSAMHVSNKPLFCDTYDQRPLHCPDKLGNDRGPPPDLHLWHTQPGTWIDLSHQCDTRARRRDILGKARE